MKKTKCLLLTASLALATAITISCSSDDGGGGDNGGGTAGGGGGGSTSGSFTMQGALIREYVGLNTSTFQPIYRDAGYDYGFDNYSSSEVRVTVGGTTKAIPACGYATIHLSTGTASVSYSSSNKIRHEVSAALDIGEYSIGGQTVSFHNGGSSGNSCGSGGGGETGSLTISGYPHTAASTYSVHALNVNPVSASNYLSLQSSASGSGIMQAGGTVTWIKVPPDGTYTIVVYRRTGSSSGTDETYYYKATGVSISNGNGSVAWSRFNAFN